MNKRIFQNIKVTIEKNSKQEHYMVTYFSLLNDKIVLWLYQWDLIIELNQDDKVFKNWKQLKF